MNKSQIYQNEWLAIHPYTAVQSSDVYFVKLVNRLYAACRLKELPDFYRRKLALYTAAYLEDVISGLGLWRSFVAGHERLYGKKLPFYRLSADYQTDEINVEDIRFLIWNTWQKAHFEHPYLNPLDPRIQEQADVFYQLLAEVYEEAPSNVFLEGCMDGYANMKDCERKLDWLFGHSYLTEPSMLPYITQVKPADRYVIPVGPLAFFLHEWLDLLSRGDAWKDVPDLYQGDPAVPEAVRQKNAEISRLFLEGTGGKTRVYLKGYDALRTFLTTVLQWPDDENHTLPQMREFHDFVLMTNPQKGVLLAKDVCPFIADPENPYYEKAQAAQGAFRMLTEEGVCPSDLLTFCIRSQYLPDAALPDGEGRELVQAHADFIARHALLYYYRAD